MNKLSIPSKKDFLNILNKFNAFLTSKLSLLDRNNLKQFFIELIYDRRFIFTLIITFVSIFAHLSTPAFYKDDWVLAKIKMQLENEFNINFKLPKKISYSMFPVPNFHLKNVRFEQDGRELGKIEKMVVYLTFNKFLNKEKINIQDIHIKNSQFNLYGKDLKDLINFFDKQINNKKLIIKKSKIFLKNNADEVFTILTLDKSISNYDIETLKNTLSLKGNIFNNSLNLNFSNDPKNKTSDLEFELKEIGKKIVINLEYKDKNNKGNLELIGSNSNFVTDFEFNDKKLFLTSEKKIYDDPLYIADIKLDPFFAKININLDSVDLFNLVSDERLFMKILSSNLIKNENINYKIELNSQNVENHRLLKNLVMCLTYKNSILSLDGTKILFDDDLKISLKNSELVSNLNEYFFKGKLNFEIKDSNKLYKFFQTNKKYRKRIKNIEFIFKYNFINNELLIEKVIVDNTYNDKIKNLIKYYNKKNFKEIRRIEIRNFFNDLVSKL